MKKNFTLLVTLLLFVVLRAAAITSGIDTVNIKRWVGKGSNYAALAVKWYNEKGDAKTLVWGYRWAEGETKTGLDMLLDVAKSDHRFYVLTRQKTMFGAAIGGLGYDEDDNGQFGLTDGTDTIYPRNGIVDVNSNAFDSWKAVDDADMWNSGWYSGFWNYNIASSTDGELQSSMVGASSRTLASGCVDAYVFSPSTASNTYDGNLTYLPAQSDYSNGAFVVNEDWFGHRNSSVNFLSSDGMWEYETIANVGVTACFGAFYGNHFYVMSKQAGTNIGGRVCIYDARSMKLQKEIAVIDASKSSCDGRSFVGVDAHKGYVSTSGGIYVLDLDKQAISGEVKDADGNAFEGECGNMIRLNDYVYCVTAKKGIAVIDPSTDKAVKYFSGSFASITLSKDGTLWASLSDGGLAKLNLTTGEAETITLPDGIGAPATSSWAWTPDGLCASKQHNVIYWTSMTGWSVYKVFKYDIDSKTFSTYIDLTNDADGVNIYGCSFRVDPVSDCGYASVTKGYTNFYQVRKYDAQGNQLAIYPMNDEQKNYWFPGMFVFPDTKDPVFSAQYVTVAVNQSDTIDLASMASDADNMDAAIVKTLTSVDNEDVVAAEIVDGKLIVKGLQVGSTTINLSLNSNGIVVPASLDVTVSESTAITAVKTDNQRDDAIYNLAGQRVGKDYKGVVIINGKKVVRR